MSISRRIEIAVALIAAVAAVLVLTACGGSSAAAPSPPPSASAAPVPTALTLIAACRLLRTDILNNGGTPDRATLQRIVDQATDRRLTFDAQETLPDVGSNSLAMGFNLSLMYSDCRSTGVQIPTSGGSV